MDSIKRADSNLSISSLILNSSQTDDTESTIKKNSALNLLSEANSDIAAENSVLGDEIVELLDVLKFDLKSLPHDIKEKLNKCTAILKSQGLSSFDESALQLSLEKRNIQNKMKEREERLLKARYNAMFTKYNALQEKLNDIRIEIEEIENALQPKISNEEDTESDRVIWTSRLGDYQEVIKKLEQELESIQSQDISLDKTLEKSSLIMEKLNDLNELDNNLKEYGDLPPNLLQAKNMLVHKKQELEEIISLINNKINN